MDSEYLKQHVGDALKLGLAEVCMKKPFDPIDYLSQWLKKYVVNQEEKFQALIEEEELLREKELAEEEKRRQQAMLEEQNQIADDIMKRDQEKVSSEEITSDIAEEDKMSDKKPEKDPYFDLIMNEDLANNKWPAALDTIHENKDHQSLMAKHMTKELWEKLKDHKTATAGWTLARAINTGVSYPTSFVGCHAGDAESYHDFKDLFYPVIESYHKGFKTDGSMKHITDMDVTKITNDLEESTKEKIFSTRIRTARNIKLFPLNPGGTKETRLEIAELMGKVFAGLEDDLAGTFYKHSNMSPEETQALVDKHFLFRGKDKMQAASGYHEYWPHGRGIFVSNDEKFLVWVNEGDHLRIISMEQGGDVKSVFSRLSRGVKAIEDGLKSVTGATDVFMHHEILGKISCCPSNLGTCVRGSVHIRVPKLIAKIGFEELDKIARGMNCQARGSSGEHSEVIDRIDLSNWRRLGFTEYQLVKDMIECANHVSKMEDECE